LSFNASVLFWGAILSGIPLLIGFIVSFREFIKQRYRQNFYLAATWLSITIWQFGLGFAELTLSRPVKQISDYFLIFSCLFTCLLMDAVSKEHIDPFKMSITHILGMIVIFMSFRPDAIIIGEREGLPGIISIYSNSYFKYFGALLILYMGLIILIYTGKIYFASPKGLKKYAGLNFFGAILAALITPLGFLMNLSISVPGLTNFIMSVGMLLIAISFAKEPKLAYVLPFKALRLTALHTAGGICLFTHDWVKKNMFVDDVLFSGMMQGISGILDESLKKGNVNEIILDEAHLLIERSKVNKEMVFILIVTKSTLGLRNALTKFTQEFIAKYNDAIKRDYNEVGQFLAASEIVLDCFPFVPEYE
jgi:hypothetical protein